MAFLGVLAGALGRSSSTFHQCPAQDEPHNTEYNYMYKLLIQMQCQLLITETVIGCSGDSYVLVQAWYLVLYGVEESLPYHSFATPLGR